MMDLAKAFKANILSILGWLIEFIWEGGSSETISDPSFPENIGR